MKPRTATETAALLLLALFAFESPGSHPLSAKASAAGTVLSDGEVLLLEGGEMDALMEKPSCLEGFRPGPSGPLIRLDAPEGALRDSTFIVEPVQFRSEDFLIQGWLYLPEEGGRFPLVVLTNGGGGNVRAIRSLSDFMAPVLAHCGIAAFVHDKRGTGASEGVLRETDYEDYIADTGNAALFLSGDPRFDLDRIGVLGGSEGGRVAVLAANRYPVFDFVVSMMGPAIGMVQDRFLAEANAAESRGLGDVAWEEIAPVWRGLMEAFASDDPGAFERADEAILAARERFPRRVLPYTSREIEGNPASDDFLPTWRSLKYDYVTEMESFDKPWLALYGAEDRIVPPEPNIREIRRATGLSGNTDVSIGVFPRCGHSPVDSETGRRIQFENIILNWMEARGIGGGAPSHASARSDTRR